MEHASRHERALYQNDSVYRAAACQHAGRIALSSSFVTEQASYPKDSECVPLDGVLTPEPSSLTTVSPRIWLGPTGPVDGGNSRSGTPIFVIG